MTLEIPGLLNGAKGMHHTSVSDSRETLPKIDFPPATTPPQTPVFAVLLLPEGGAASAAQHTLPSGHTRELLKALHLIRSESSAKYSHTPNCVGPQTLL